MSFISIEENQTSEPSASKKKMKCSHKGKLSSSCQSKNSFTKKRFNQRRGGIIYIGHIPHGFYEDEMRSYFNQFGKVIATWIARSKKTGRSRGYGFVQFKDEEVAQIAAEAMNNYLMFNKIIKCRYIPPEERKFNVYESDISVSNCPRQKNRKIELRNKNKALAKLTQSHYLQKVQKKLNNIKKFFHENNIEFNLKVTDESSKDNSINLEIKEKKTKTSSLPKKSENDTDNINGVLEIDGSDSEISFKTPPQVKKIIKRFSNSFAAPQKDFVSSCNYLVGKVSEKNSDSKRILKLKKRKMKIGTIKQTQKNKKVKEISEKIKKEEN